MSRPRSILILSAVLLFSLRSLAQSPVPPERLLNAAKEPQNWLMYGGDYSSNRHSSLTQITPLNVKNLTFAWAYQSPNTGSWEATPLVLDGIMYLTQRPNDVVALDARHSWRAGRSQSASRSNQQLDGCGRARCRPRDRSEYR